MIKAESLDYRKIAAALESGDFYASMGPEIHELYVEDDKVYIKCSPAARISMNTGIRSARQVWAKDGEMLTEACFAIDEKYGYFRLTVTDAQGCHANTNAYFWTSLENK